MGSDFFISVGTQKLARSVVFIHCFVRIVMWWDLGSPFKIGKQTEPVWLMYWIKNAPGGCITCRGCSASVVPVFVLARRYGAGPYVYPMRCRVMCTFCDCMMLGVTVSWYSLSQANHDFESFRSLPSPTLHLFLLCIFSYYSFAVITNHRVSYSSPSVSFRKFPTPFIVYYKFFLINLSKFITFILYIGFVIKVL